MRHQQLVLLLIFFMSAGPTLAFQQSGNINAQDLSGRTALINAALFGKAKEVEALIAKGADVNIQDAEGRTALICGVTSGSVEVVKALINAKADPSIKDSKKLMAINYAIDFGYNNIAQLLRDARDQNGRTALILAVINRQPADVALLIKYGFDINATDNSGQTALIYAATQGNLPLVKLLVNAKADKSVKDESGLTAAEIAEANGHPEIVEFLTGEKKSVVTAKTETAPEPAKDDTAEVRRLIVSDVEERLTATKYIDDITATVKVEIGGADNGVEATRKTTSLVESVGGRIVATPGKEVNVREALYYRFFFDIARISLPAYPEEAIRNKVEGAVKVVIEIKRNGEVGNVEVIEGSSEFQDVVINALKNWRFKPTEFPGNAYFTFNFTLGTVSQQ